MDHARRHHRPRAILVPDPNPKPLPPRDRNCYFRRAAGVGGCLPEGHARWLRRFKLPDGVVVPGFVQGRGIYPVGAVPHPLSAEEAAQFARIDAALLVEHCRHCLGGVGACGW